MILAVSHMETFHVDYIIVQAQIVAELLQAADYAITINGIRTLSQIFKKANIMFKKVSSDLTSDFTLKIFESLMKIAGILIKVTN